MSRKKLGEILIDLSEIEVETGQKSITGETLKKLLQIKQHLISGYANNIKDAKNIKLLINDSEQPLNIIVNGDVYLNDLGSLIITALVCKYMDDTELNTIEYRLEVTEDTASITKNEVDLSVTE